MLSSPQLSKESNIDSPNLRTLLPFDRIVNTLVTTNLNREKSSLLGSHNNEKMNQSPTRYFMNNNYIKKPFTRCSNPNNIKTIKRTELRTNSQTDSKTVSQFDFTISNTKPNLPQRQLKEGQLNNKVINLNHKISDTFQAKKPKITDGRCKSYDLPSYQNLFSLMIDEKKYENKNLR